MRTFTAVLTILITGVSYAQNEYFYDMGNNVGYIKDDKGNKYIVVEENSGAKLVKVKEDPETLMRDKFGISKEDLKIGGEEK